jgi:hypothetical protein
VITGAFKKKIASQSHHKKKNSGEAKDSVIFPMSIVQQGPAVINTVYLF